MGIKVDEAVWPVVFAGIFAKFGPEVVPGKVSLAAGKFVGHNLVTGEGQAAPEFYGELFGWYGEVFYSAPIDRYGYGFYGHL